jgi:hypothetical protein
MISYQYDLFEKPCDDINLCHEKADAALSQVNNLRRGFFSRYTELGKLIIKQQQEIEQLRNMIMEIRNK